MEIVVTYPLEFAKTHLQLQHSAAGTGSGFDKGVVDCLRTTYRASGVRGVYQGCTRGRGVVLQSFLGGRRCLVPLDHWSMGWYTRTHASAGVVAAVADEALDRSWFVFAGPRSAVRFGLLAWAARGLREGEAVAALVEQGDVVAARERTASAARLVRSLAKTST